MMIGIIVPDSGGVSIFGEPLERAHMDRVGYLPEERGLYKKMKVLEHLVFLAQLKGLTAHERPPALGRARAFRVRHLLDGEEGGRAFQGNAAEAAVYRCRPA